MAMELRQRPGGAHPEPVATPRKFNKVLRSLDMFPKVESDHHESSGSNHTSVISIVTGVVIALLFLHEFWRYLEVRVDEHMVVDSFARDKLEINFNITFPHIPCTEANIDLIDTVGEQVLSVESGVYKQEISSDGKAINQPYLEQGGNHRVTTQPGCTTWGQLLVNRVGGNFHVTIGETASRGTTTHVHQFKFSDAAKYNSSHRINHLSFGPKFDNQKNPLDGYINMGTGINHYTYTIKVVPTTVISLGGNVLHTNQYSYTSLVKEITQFDHTMSKYTIPGVFFVYDLSAFRIKSIESKMPFLRFLTSVCAIVGGVFTVSGLLASLLHHTGVGKSLGM